MSTLVPFLTAEFLGTATWLWLIFITIVISLLVFHGIVGWAWSRRNRERFDEAARLPFQDE